MSGQMEVVSPSDLRLDEAILDNPPSRHDRIATIWCYVRMQRELPPSYWLQSLLVSGPYDEFGQFKNTSGTRSTEEGQASYSIDAKRIKTFAY